MIDTTGTYHAAYLIVALIYAGYAWTLRRRARKYAQRLTEPTRDRERGA